MMVDIAFHHQHAKPLTLLPAPANSLTTPNPILSAERGCCTRMFKKMKSTLYE